MLNKITVEVSGPYTIERTSNAGKKLRELQECFRAKLQGLAIDMLEADQPMAVRAVLELSAQIEAAVMVILNEAVTPVE